MITKQIKEYSKRLRINIVNSDGLKAGDNVILLTEQEYQAIQEEKTNLTNALKDKENKLHNTNKQQENFKSMMDNLLEPIQENHQRELNNKDNQITELSNALNTLRNVCSQFNIDISQLSALDFLLRKKHLDLITDFNNNIWITNKKQDGIVDADVKQIINTGHSEDLKK